MPFSDRTRSEVADREVVDEGHAGRRWWKRAWVWGLLITTGLGIASAIGHSVRWQLTVIVSLAALALTASLELFLEVERNSSELRNTRRMLNILEGAAFRLSPLVAAPAALQEFAESVATDSRRVESDGHDFFRIIFTRLQHQFQQATADLAAGRVEIDANATYSFRSAAFDRFRAMRMVHVRGLEFWESRRGKSYLERQRAAVQTGSLSIERIFVLAPTQMDKASRIIAGQIAAGIRVQVMEAYSDPSGRTRADLVERWIAMSVLSPP